MWRLLSFDQKKTTQTCHKTNSNEHSFTNKGKEMANSACKMFTEHKHTEQHHDQNGGHHAHHGVAKTHNSGNHESHASCHVQQQSARQGSHLNTANTCTAATDHKKKKKGHGGNFIANIGEHIKNMKNKKLRKAGKCNGTSRDSSSSSSYDESNKETSANEKEHNSYLIR
ncbi:hypothetical protein ACH5RR_038330 [Cinchona calisaya]|uniref:Uncharacterized protein n=1 Tax=Cinchona calisaya TaxID=153742 RepID=A0ABD2XY94_9GENT